MGRKTNSIGLRLKKTNKDYNNCWYSECLYNYHFSKSLKVQNYFEAAFKTIRVSCPKMSHIHAYKKSTLLVCYLDRNKKTFLYNRALGQKGLSKKGFGTPRSTRWPCKLKICNPFKKFFFEFLKSKASRIGQGTLAPNFDIFWKSNPKALLHDNAKGPFVDNYKLLGVLKKTKLKRSNLSPLGLSFYNCEESVKENRGGSKPELVKKNPTISRKLCLVEEKRTDLAKSIAALTTLSTHAMQATQIFNRVQMENLRGLARGRGLGDVRFKGPLKPKGCVQMEHLQGSQSFDQPVVFATKEKGEKSLGYALDNFPSLGTHLSLSSTPAKIPSQALNLSRFSKNSCMKIMQTPPTHQIFKNGEKVLFENKGLGPTTSFLTFYHNSIFFETKKEKEVFSFFGKLLSKKIEKDNFLFCALFLSLWLYGAVKKSLSLTPEAFSLYGSETQRVLPVGGSTRWVLDPPRVLKNKPFYNLLAPNSSFFLGLQKCLCDFWKNNVSTHFYKTTNEKSSALFLAHTVSYLLERKVPFRSIKRLFLQFLKKSLGSRKLAFKAQAAKRKITGIRISCSGRVGGRSKKAQRARKETFMWGETGLHVFEKRLDFAKTHAETPFGLIGVKVWVCTK